MINSKKVSFICIRLKVRGKILYDKNDLEIFNSQNLRFYTLISFMIYYYDQKVPGTFE